MAVFNASTRTSSGVTWAPGASDTLAKWLNSKSWTGQFQDWAVDSDGDLESIVWSSDGRSTLSFYLSGWRQSGSGFNATGLAFQVLDDLGGADNRAAAFWDGSIYLSRDFKTMTGTVTEIQESTNDDNYWNASGSWDASRLYSGTPDQVISYMFSGSDQITGSRFADIINSGSGDDNITGGGGDDFIDGGAGADQARFQGVYSDYTITQDGQSRLVVADGVSGRDGRDVITGIETLVFSDQSISASSLTPASPSPPVSITPGNGSPINAALVSDLVSRAWRRPEDISGGNDATYFLDTKGNKRLHSRLLTKKGSIGLISAKEQSFRRSLMKELDGVINAGIREVSNPKVADIIIGCMGKSRRLVARSDVKAGRVNSMWTDRGGNKVTSYEKELIAYAVVGSFGLNSPGKEFSTQESVMGWNSNGYYGLTSNDKEALQQLWNT